MAQLQILYTEWLDEDLVGWIQINLLPQSLAWLFGFDANHSFLVFVHYWHHHIETRQIQNISFLNVVDNQCKIIAKFSDLILS